MVITNIQTVRLFRTKLFETMFREMFNYESRSTGESTPRGPLAYIVKKYPLVAAKGGAKNIKYRDYPDQTYLTHIVNGLVIGGRLLENKVLKKYHTPDNIPKEFERMLRLYFAAFVLHDINKFDPGHTLVETVSNEWSRFSTIVAPFMNNVGDPQLWAEDLKYLIYSTEEGTKDYANLLKTTVPRDYLENLSWYMKLSDSVGNIKAKTSLQIYYKMKEIMNRFSDESNDTLNFITFADIPQTLLRVHASDAVLKALDDADRFIVLKTPDAIIFEGKQITPEIIATSTEMMRNDITLTINDLASLYPPSNNSYKIETIAEKVKVTPEVIDAIITKLKGKLLFWSGKSWLTAHPEFAVMMQSKYNVKFERKGDGRKEDTKDTMKEDKEASYQLIFPDESPEYDEEDADLNKRMLLSKLIVGNRLAMDLGLLDVNNPVITKWLEENKVLSQSESIDLILRKTLSAIAQAMIDGGGNPIDEYEKRIKSIVDKLEEAPKEEAIDISQFLMSIMSYGSSDTDLLTRVHDENVDKKDMCLQCGSPGIIKIDDSRVFAYGATGGTGRKVTKLKDDPRFKGKLCRLCETENVLRRKIFGLDGKKGLVIQCHVGDYLVPFDISLLADILRERVTTDSKKNSEMETGMVLLTRFDAPHKLDHHMVVYHKIQEKRHEQFYFIQQLLTFVSNTGIKIHITPLHGAPRIRAEQFTWENAPGWVKSLKMNTMRIDEIHDAIEELKIIDKVSSLGRGMKDIPHVLSSRGLHPIMMFSLMYNVSKQKGIINIKPIENELRIYINKYSKEVYEMEMRNIVKEACKIIKHAPESNNEHTWMIRTAFDSLSLNMDTSRDERVSICAGSILGIAKRKKSFNQEDGAKACVAFSDNLVTLIDERFNGKVPASKWRRALIDQFALLYGQQKKAEKDNNQAVIIKDGI